MKYKLMNFSNSYNTEKAKTFFEFANNEIPFPTTALLNSRDLTMLDRFIDCIKEWNTESVYLRACFSDHQYPHYYSVFSSSNCIELDARQLLTKVIQNGIIDFDLICQPFLENTEWSGGIIKTHSSIYFEIVKGAAISMYREGEFLFGYFQNVNRRFIRKGNQTEVLYLNKGKIERDKLKQLDIHYEYILERYLNKLSIDKLCAGKLYEFGIINEAVCYFESKRFPSKAYKQIDQICNNEIISLNKEEKRDVANSHKCDETIVLHRPTFNLVVEPCAYIDKHVLLESCPILSHFVVWLLDNSVDCKLKNDTSSIVLL